MRHRYYMIVNHEQHEQPFAFLCPVLTACKLNASLQAQADPFVAIAVYCWTVLKKTSITAILRAGCDMGCFEAQSHLELPQSMLSVCVCMCLSVQNGTN